MCCATIIYTAIRQIHIASVVRRHSRKKEKDVYNIDDLLKYQPLSVVRQI